MRIKKDQIFTSLSDLNNFVSCKYHTFNDLHEYKNGLKKKPPEDMKLWRRYGNEHEKKHFKLLQKFSFVTQETLNINRTNSSFIINN